LNRARRRRCIVASRRERWCVKAAAFAVFPNLKAQPFSQQDFSSLKAAAPSAFAASTHMDFDFA